MQAVRVVRNGVSVPCPTHLREELLVVVEGTACGKRGCRRCMAGVEVDPKRTADHDTGEITREVA